MPIKGSYSQDYLALAIQAKGAGKVALALTLAAAARAQLQEQVDIIDKFTSETAEEAGAQERVSLGSRTGLHVSKIIKSVKGKGSRPGRAKGFKMSAEARAKIAAAARNRKRDKFGRLVSGKAKSKTQVVTKKKSPRRKKK